jgi:uncharacterized protein YndB with AHSA1/START domain
MTTERNKLIVTTPSDLEIRQERTFNAPRELVFKVMSDPNLIPRWWGPARYPTRVDVMDFRPGGKWRFISSDGEGNEFAFRGEYREIVPPSRIVQTFEFEPMAGHISVETGELTEVDGKTIFVTTSVFASKEDRDGMLASGMEEGAAETMDRLEDLLASLAA